MWLLLQLLLLLLLLRDHYGLSPPVLLHLCLLVL